MRMLEANGMGQLVLMRDAVKTAGRDGMLQAAIGRTVRGPIDGNESLIRIAPWRVGVAIGTFRIRVVQGVKPQLNVVVVVVTPIDKTQRTNLFDGQHRPLHPPSFCGGPAPGGITAELPVRQIRRVTDEGESNGGIVRSHPPTEAIRQAINPLVARTGNSNRCLVRQNSTLGSA